MDIFLGGFPGNSQFLIKINIYDSLIPMTNTHLKVAGCDSQIQTSLEDVLKPLLQRLDVTLL